MGSAAHLLAAAAFAFATPTAGVATAPAAKPRPPATFSALRLCTIEQFDSRTAECRRDERARPFVSTGFACSATVRVRRATSLIGVLTFNGAEEGRFKVRPPGRGLYTVYLTIQFPTTRLPAGTFGCRFEGASARIAGVARSAGPTGPVLGAAACLTAGAADHGQGGCNADATAVPLPANQPVTCSAVLPGQSGHSAAVELVSTADGQATVVSRQEALVPVPLVEVFVSSSPTGLAPGSYSCRFSVDGQVVAEKPFTVA